MRSGVLKQVNLLADGKNIFRFLALLPEQLILQLVQLRPHLRHVISNRRELGL